MTEPVTTSCTDAHVASSCPDAATPPSAPGHAPAPDPSAMRNDIAQRLAALGCDPLAIMAAIACDEADARLRLAAAKELAGYLLTKPYRTLGESVAARDVGDIIAHAWVRGPEQ